MTIISIQGVEAKLGRESELLDVLRDVKPAIQSRGGGRTRLMKIVTGGPATGGMYGEIEFSNFTERGIFSDRIANDTEYQTLLEKAVGPDGPGSTSMVLLGKVIHEYAPGHEGYEGAVELIRSWSVKPGRIQEFIDLAGQATKHTEKFGGRVRILSTVIGGDDTGSMYSVAEFPDIVALGKYLDAFSENPELSELFAKAMGENSPATMGSNEIHKAIIG